MSYFQHGGCEIWNYWKRYSYSTWSQVGVVDDDATENQPIKISMEPFNCIAFSWHQIYMHYTEKILLKTISLFTVLRAKVFIFLDDKNLHSAPKRKIRPGAEYIYDKKKPKRWKSHAAMISTTTQYCQGTIYTHHDNLQNRLPLPLPA